MKWLKSFFRRREPDRSGWYPPYPLPPTPRPPWSVLADADADGVEVDRDSDGELLIDWSPGKGRMISMTLRDDGRLSYAFTWDGESAHGTAQMPPPTPRSPQ